MAVKNFRHKGLREFFETDRTRGIRPDQAKRLRRALTVLNTADTLDEKGGARLAATSSRRRSQGLVEHQHNWELALDIPVRRRRRPTTSTWSTITENMRN
jgi:proteic killer suppression protein